MLYGSHILGPVPTRGGTGSSMKLYVFLGTMFSARRPNISMSQSPLMHWQEIVTCVGHNDVYQLVQDQQDEDGIKGQRDKHENLLQVIGYQSCLLYTSPSPRDGLLSRMPSSA